MPVNLSDIHPTFFASAADFRHWLEKNHDKEKELWVGYYKIGSGKSGLTWQDSVKVALCYGWIDGIRKGLNETSYTNRFTPRRLNSNWSEINIKSVEDLIKNGMMRPSGLKVFETRKQKNKFYSYEKKKPD